MKINFEKAICKNPSCILKGEILNYFQFRDIKNSKNKAIIDAIKKEIPLKFKEISKAIMEEVGHINYIDFWEYVTIIKVK